MAFPRARSVSRTVIDWGNLVVILLLVRVLVTSVIHFGFDFDRVAIVLTVDLGILIILFMSVKTVPVWLCRVGAMALLVVSVATLVFMAVGAPGTVCITV